MAKLDQLKKEVDDFKKSLNELKSNISISEIERKTKLETLKTQAEVTKQKLQAEIATLSDKADAYSKKEKEKAKALLNSINESLTLYTSILNWSKKAKQTTPTQPTTEEKNIFEKAKDWIWDQWDAIWDKSKWERSAEWWKNLLRTAWFVATWAWAIALVYKWVKKLWNWAFSDDEDEEQWEESQEKAENEQQDTESESREETQTKSKKKKKEESFWDTWYWEALKWLWIGSVAWWGAYAISRNLWWNKDKKNEWQKTETIQQWWDTISDAMFQQLLKMEWDQDFVAKTHSKKFWENFVTWPYGMVYKHIDNNWNLLDKPVAFKNGEHVSKDWAEKNARAYYNKRAKERSDLLRSKWYEYTQDMLDALVSASWWTEKSVTRLKNFVLTHWDDKDAIFNFMSKFATTAAWNWKTMPGLVIRRNFEANWFRWNKEPMSEYQRRYYA